MLRGEAKAKEAGEGDFREFPEGGLLVPQQGRGMQPSGSRSQAACMSVTMDVGVAPPKCAKSDRGVYLPAEE